MEPKSIGPNLGSLLGGLFDQVNGTIQQAAEEFKNAGMELEIGAGQQLSIAMDQFKNYYQDELDYTIDKVKKETKDTFDRLNSMVAVFQNKNLEALQDLQVQAQQLANSLPFSSKQPQLSYLKPRYLVIQDLAFSSLVLFKGNFPCSSLPGFEPSLVFKDKTCLLVDSSTQWLTFQVPHSSFEDAIKDKYSYRTGELVVPWDDGWFRSHKVESTYKVGLGALPQQAGKGAVEYIAKNTETHTEHTITDPIEFNGNNWYPEHWHTIYQSVFPKPGWSIDCSKPPKLRVEDKHGRHSQEIVSVSPSQIVYKVSLYCKTGEDIGIVKIQVEFDQYLKQIVDTKRTEEFEMNWKDQKLLEPQGNEVISKVVFDNYIGVHQEFGAPDIDGGTLKVVAEGNGKWKVWAEPPKDLQIASSDLSKAAKEKIATAEKLQHLIKLANVTKG